MDTPSQISHVDFQPDPQHLGSTRCHKYAAVVAALELPEYHNRTAEVVIAVEVAPPEMEGTQKLLPPRFRGKGKPKSKKTKKKLLFSKIKFTDLVS